MATNFFELATTLNNLGAKWLSEKKINFTPYPYILNRNETTYNFNYFLRWHLNQIITMHKEMHSLHIDLFDYFLWPLTLDSAGKLIDDFFQLYRKEKSKN